MKDGEFLKCDYISFVKQGDDLRVYKGRTVGFTGIIEDFFKGEKGVIVRLTGKGRKTIMPGGPREEVLCVVGVRMPSGKGFRIDVKTSDGEIAFKETYEGEFPRKIPSWLEQVERKSIEFLDP